MSVPERRTSTRVALTVFVRFGREDDDAFLESFSANIGHGGLFLQTKSPLPEGTSVTLEILLGTEILAAEGRVVWGHRSGMGIRFVRMSDPAWELLKRTIAAHLAEPPLQTMAIEPPEEEPESLPPFPPPPRFTPPPPPPASLTTSAPLPVIGKSTAASMEIPHPRAAGQSTRPLALPAGTRPKPFQFPRLEGAASSRMIGIDLGTAFSCAAYVKDGAPQMIPGDKGKRSFPSAVFVRGEELLLGTGARERSESNPGNVIHSWKRLLGRGYESQAVRDATDHLAYQVEPGPEGEAVVRIDDVLYWPSWFAARVLYEIRRWTLDHLGEVVTRAVVTVPAYYTNRQRDAVKEGAALAGFEVVRLLNEPVAAAVAYGIGREFQKRLLVYDLGGGTFDVSVVEVDGNVFQVAATGGDSYLGGVDFDDRVMGQLMLEFLRQENINLVNDVLALARLRAAAEKAKLELSSLERTHVSIPYLARRGDAHLRLETDLTRAELESLTADLVDRSLHACDAVLAQAGLHVSEIDEVLLVGGMTRMPLVQSRVEDHFGRPPRKGAHPDEAVGLGAALFAASLGSGSMAVLDVLSLAVGVELPEGSFQAVIAPKAPLPAEKALTIHAAHDGQSEFGLDVFQGNSVNIGECEYLGTLTLEDLPPARQGEPLCETRFRLDEEGTLSVRQIDASGVAGPPISLTVDPRVSSAASTRVGRGLGFFRRLLGLSS